MNVCESNTARCHKRLLKTKENNMSCMIGVLLVMKKKRARSAGGIVKAKMAIRKHVEKCQTCKVDMRKKRV